MYIKTDYHIRIHGLSRTHCKITFSPFFLARSHPQLIRRSVTDSCVSSRCTRHPLASGGEMQMTFPVSFGAKSRPKRHPYFVQSLSNVNLVHQDTWHRGRACAHQTKMLIGTNHSALFEAQCIAFFYWLWRTQKSSAEHY